MNAIRVPSGDHAASYSGSPLRVRLVVPDPSAATATTWLLLPNVPSNPTTSSVRPSGDQAGTALMSWARSATCVTAEPSALMTYRPLVLISPPVGPLMGGPPVELKAIRDPSGDQAASPA